MNPVVVVVVAVVAVIVLRLRYVRSCECNYNVCSRNFVRRIFYCSNNNKENVLKKNAIEDSNVSDVTQPRMIHLFKLLWYCVHDRVRMKNHHKRCHIVFFFHVKVNRDFKPYSLRLLHKILYLSLVRISSSSSTANSPSSSLCATIFGGNKCEILKFIFNYSDDPYRNFKECRKQ